MFHLKNLLEYNYSRRRVPVLLNPSGVRNLEMLKIIRKSFYVAAIAGLATLSPAQWVGTSIHPPGYTQSRALGASEGIVVGWSGSPNAGAGYWLNGGSNYVSLDDPTWTFSVAYQGNSSVQVGAYTKGFTHASKWNGSLATLEDLNPARSSESQGGNGCAVLRLWIR